jgi:5-epi-alpha-selinene synthase
MIRRADLPKLYCPLQPPGINEHVEVAEAHSLQWAREFDLVPEGGTEYQALRAAKSAWYVGYSNPNASVEDLNLMADWTVWLFVKDDLSDATDRGKDPERLAALHRKLLPVLHGTEVPAQDEPLVRALHDIYQRLVQRTDTLWVQRFAYDVEQYLQGHIWEATNRRDGITPNLATYVKFRPYTMVIAPSFDLTFLVKGIAPNARFLRHIYIQQLTVMAMNQIAWTNDILGLGRELREDNPHNLVFVLQREHDIPLQDALNQAAKMCNAEMKAFVELEARLPTFSETEDVSMKSYVEGLQSWIRGHLDWYSQTNRYPF